MVTRREFVGWAAGAMTLGTGCARAPTQPHPVDLTALTLADASALVRAGRVSPVALTQACLDRIAALNPRFNCFITVLAERALEQATAAEREIKAGRWRGPLHGIPIAIKDNIDTAGIRTTAGSAAFLRRVPARNADVVDRLEAAGAVCLGKLCLHELAVGSTGAISHFGPVRNPWDRRRISGGSSSGAAAALAARLCYGAVGTDTGGSLRVPAACCGVVGFAPSAGVVSTRGIVPVARSLDTVGPMARTVEDVALLLAALTAHPAAHDARGVKPLSALRIGVIPVEEGLCDHPASGAILAPYVRAVNQLRELVASIDVAHFSAPPVQDLLTAEFHFDHAPFMARELALVRPATRAQLEGGAQVPAPELARLRAELATFRAGVNKAFQNVDLFVNPTIPVEPRLLTNALGPFDQPACTLPFTVAGLPSLAIPCGFTEAGLPVGLLISGPPMSELQVLALGRAYQARTDWHRRAPEL